MVKIKHRYFVPTTSVIKDMPIYEFECKDCGARFECLFRSAEEKVDCFNCKGKNLKKLFSNFALRGTKDKGSSVSSCSGCSATDCSTCTPR